MRLDEHQERVEQAQTRLNAGLRVLQRPDGTRLYSDDEHREREAALHREFRQTLTEAGRAADEVATAANAQLDEPRGDLVHALTPAELERANLMKAFIVDELAQLSPADVVQRVELELRTGDKVSRFLCHRFLRQAMASQDPTNRRVAVTYQTLIERLEAALLDPAKEAKRQAACEQARARQSEATALAAEVALAARLQDTYGQRPSIR